MKASTITAILAFTATAIAAPSSPYPRVSKPSVFGKRDVQQAVNDCQNTATPDVCEQVVTAIAAWDDSVNEVNQFLNTANNLSGQDLTNAEFNALRFANAEPGFLSTLQGTPGLSQAGQNAANILGHVFPAVPQNLVELTQSEILVSDAVNNINNVRYVYLFFFLI
jgi:hypothetical protein